MGGLAGLGFRARPGSRAVRCWTAGAERRAAGVGPDGSLSGAERAAPGRRESAGVGVAEICPELGTKVPNVTFGGVLGRSRGGDEIVTLAGLGSAVRVRFLRQHP